MWPMQQQQPQPSVSVVTTVWGVASTTSQAQLPTDNMIPSISTTNTGQVMNQQPYGNPGMMNAGNKPYQQSGIVWASIPKVVGSNPTVARHIFQACPVWIYTQSSNYIHLIHLST